MSEKKRLLVVSSFAESLVNFRLMLMQDAIADGFEVHACAPDFTPPIREQLQAASISTHDILLSRNGLNPILDIATLFSLWRLINKVQPTHQLAYTIKPVIYASLAARLAGVPKIGALVTGLGYAFMQADNRRQKWVGWIARWLYKCSLSGTSVVFFQNPDDRQLFIDNRLVKASKVRIVNGSGIDLKQFSHQPLPSGDSLHFVIIGRILADKGMREFAAAATTIRQRHPNTRFHLVGWLDSNPSAIQQSELDCWLAEGALTFHGKLDDVRDIIAQSHVYVLPSYREGTPRTVLEAMAIGRAIITTDAPGCRQTIEDGVSGWLIEVANVDALVKAIERYINNSALIKQHGNNARRRAEAVYDVKKVNKDMLEGLQK